MEDLKELGLPAGRPVLVHASLEAIGPIEAGAETLVAAFREALGPEGTLLVTTFAFDPAAGAADRSGLQNVLSPLDSPAGQQGLSGNAGVPSAAHWTSGFAETVRQQPDAFRSDHPALSFTALGAEAQALTTHVPFHYPLGSDGPLARLHQRNGWICLIGVGHSANMSLHLAEIWANVPYVHRTALVKTVSGEDATMLGSPDCSAGFARIEPVLRQSRILRRGYVGNAESQLMRQQQTVSMAIAMLQGDPSALLCENETCPACTLARRMTAEQIVEPI